MQRIFKQIDVFSKMALKGNPLAVVIDAAGLSTDEMQNFASWTNLSETTFLTTPTEPTADYAVRIFTPDGELPFAGHPTLGSCYAWLKAGGVPKGEFIVQQCAAGLVKIRQQNGRLAFAAPPLIKHGPLSDDDLQIIAWGLGILKSDIIAHNWCDNGPYWRAIKLNSAAEVLALKPNAALLGDFKIGVVGSHSKEKSDIMPAQNDEPLFEVRAFCCGNGTCVEDPVTGSLNAGLAQWFIGAGMAPDQYIVSQGTAVGRAGRVFIQKEGANIWVGGHCSEIIEGVVYL